jgi:hypothetical protein
MAKVLSDNDISDITQPLKQLMKNMSKPQKKHLNEGISLEQFDYTKMVGKPFNDYIDLVEGTIIDEDDPLERRGGGLDQTKNYMFEVYKVSPEWKKLYPKSQKDDTMVLKGFKLLNSAPIKTSNTTLRSALMLNSQLASKQTGGQYPGTTGNVGVTYEYYLLQKPTTVKND